MAVGATYPAIIKNANGDETQGIDITFTDSGNQPSGDTVPFVPDTGDDVVVLETSTGDPLIEGGDDTGGVKLLSADGTNGVTVNNTGTSVDGDFTVAGETTFQDDVSAVTSEVTVQDLSVAGLTGAVSVTRYVGGTADIAPVAGTFAVGDWVVSLTGKTWVCTVAGTPGTWVQANSGTYAPLASPTFTGTVTVPAAAAVNAAARLSQLTSALTVTSGTLPNLGTWSSDTAIQNPVTRQITVNVAFVTNGTANAATCAIAISPDNVTFTTIGTLTASVAVNTVGAVQLVSPVNLPAAWYIKLTFSQGTVAASIYY